MKLSRHLGRPPPACPIASVLSATRQPCLSALPPLPHRTSPPDPGSHWGCRRGYLHVRLHGGGRGGGGSSPTVSLSCQFNSCSKKYVGRWTHGLMQYSTPLHLQTSSLRRHLFISTDLVIHCAWPSMWSRSPGGVQPTGPVMAHGGSTADGTASLSQWRWMTLSAMDQ